MTLRLGVNIDHVATVRNARGGEHPDPVHAAKLAARGGADGITAHLREDRRHIRDADIARLKAEIALPLNLEMAATEEMLAIALKTKPNAACLVPEKRHELTTEGGLEVAGQKAVLTGYVARLKDACIRVSLFLDADARQIEAAAEAGADIVELHTGVYAGEMALLRAKRNVIPAQAGILAKTPASAGVTTSGSPRSLRSLAAAATLAASLGLEVHAGHGLNYDNAGAVAAIPEIAELNIGHFLIGEAIFIGLEESVRRMREIMDGVRGSPHPTSPRKRRDEASAASGGGKAKR